MLPESPGRQPEVVASGPGALGRPDGRPASGDFPVPVRATCSRWRCSWLVHPTVSAVGVAPGVAKWLRPHQTLHRGPRQQESRSLPRPQGLGLWAPCEHGRRLGPWAFLARHSGLGRFGVGSGGEGTDLPPELVALGVTRGLCDHLAGQRFAGLRKPAACCPNKSPAAASSVSSSLGFGDSQLFQTAQPLPPRGPVSAGPPGRVLNHAPCSDPGFMARLLGP